MSSAQCPLPHSLVHLFLRAVLHRIYPLMLNLLPDKRRVALQMRLALEMKGMMLEKMLLMQAREGDGDQGPNNSNN